MSDDRFIRTPQMPPVIAPIHSPGLHPVWSVMIPVYNCSAYLQQALESVLIQAPDKEHMQIEVVDDASTDENIESLVQRIGKGRVSYFRQPFNVGSLRNFETCINRARGNYIHLLHGDDFISPGFYREAELLFGRFPDAGAVCTGFTQVNAVGAFICNGTIDITHAGIIPGWLSIIAQNQKLQPPAVTVKREVYEKLGSFFGVHYGEDWEMWVRIAASYPVVHSPEKLAHYRVHDGNISSNFLMSGQHIKDIIKVINIVKNYLPGTEKKNWTNKARRNWSIYFAETTDKTYGAYKQYGQALKQAVMACKLHCNTVSLYYLAKTILKVLLRWKM